MFGLIDDLDNGNVDSISFLMDVIRMDLVGLYSLVVQGEKWMKRGKTPISVTVHERTF